MEEPITITNKNGKKLFGILHTPETTVPGRTRVGVNLLNPGIKYRVAPHRMNVKLARKLCSQGYYVLRFDPFEVYDPGVKPWNWTFHQVNIIHTRFWDEDYMIIPSDFTLLC